MRHGPQVNNNDGIVAIDAEKSAPNLKTETIKKQTFDSPAIVADFIENVDDSAAAWKLVDKRM